MAAQDSLRTLIGGLGALGRSVKVVQTTALNTLLHVHGLFALTLRTLYFSFIAPFAGGTKLREQLFPMMRNVGVRSLPIVALISFLMGAILVLQSGEPLRRFGQIHQVPGAVALSLTREISPLITAIVMTARVGASFTAVIASMKINDEIMALEAMVIHPIGYLVAPRFLSMVVMLPCLTIFSYLIGMVGGAVVAYSVYDIPLAAYQSHSEQYITMTDVYSGLVKSAVFGAIIAQVCCYFGLNTEGGSVGLGRHVMVAVVTSLVAVILADALATAIINNYIL